MVWHLNVVVRYTGGTRHSWAHCALENRLDLYVNERQKIQHYRARSTEERRKKNAKWLFFTLRGAYVNLRYIAMLYTHSIGNQP